MCAAARVHGRRTGGGRRDAGPHTSTGDTKWADGVNAGPPVSVSGGDAKRAGGVNAGGPAFMRPDVQVAGPDRANIIQVRR